MSLADLGLAGQGLPDASVLALAIARDRVVLTHNGKDFKRLHRQDSHHSGILVLPDDVRHVKIAEGARELLDSVADWRGRLIRLSRPTP